MAEYDLSEIKSLQRLLADNVIILVSINAYESEDMKKMCDEIFRANNFAFLGLCATKATTEKLYDIFDGKKVFTNPKPDTLLHFLV